MLRVVLHKELKLYAIAKGVVFTSRPYVETEQLSRITSIYSLIATGGVQAAGSSTLHTPSHSFIDFSEPR